MARIDRRTFIQAGAGGIMGLACPGFPHELRGNPPPNQAEDGSARPAGVPPKKPNLLFVFGDQWRRQALGFMNEDPVLTPNMDRFAEKSLVFTRAMSCCPLCTPYRATLFTGRYPISTGVIWNGVMLRPDEVCFAEVLKEGGYETSYIGKWHLDGPPNHGVPPGPRRQGFDFFHGFQSFHEHFHLRYFEDGVEPVIDEDGWQPDHETEVALRRIRGRDKDHPFALFLSFSPPHHLSGGPRFDPKGEKYQYAAPERFEKLYRGKKLPRRPNVPDDHRADALPGYFGAVSSLDENFGRILACLEEEGLAEDTVVVLTADHGEMLGSHGLMTKTFCYEESIGIPFLIRWPGRVKPGQEDLLFSSVDVMPSLLGLMDLPIPAPVEGADYSAVLRGLEAKRPDCVLIEYFPGEVNYAGGWRGLRTDRYTYVAQLKKEGHPGLLWDNREDPWQMKPKRARQGEDPLMDSLWITLKAWLERTNDPYLQWAR